MQPDPARRRAVRTRKATRGNIYKKPLDDGTGRLALPAELLDEVFKNLLPPFEVDEGAHKHELLACALVCRTWSDVVRPHLFATITFTYYTCSQQTLRYHIAKGDIRRQPRTLIEFRDFLASSPAIYNSVRTLSLVCNGVLSSQYTGSTDIGTLCSVLSPLPRLKRILLVGAYFDTDRHLSSPRRLSVDALRLSLPKCAVRGTRKALLLSNVFLAFTMFEAIGTLQIVDCNLITHVLPLGTPESFAQFDSKQLAAMNLPAPMRITSVVISNCYVRSFCQLMRALDLQALRSISLHSIHRMNGAIIWPPVLPMLEDIGDKVVHLGFTLSDEQSTVSMYDYDEFVRLCYRPKTLEFRLKISRDQWSTSLEATLVHHERVWRRLAAFISNMPSSVEHLVIEIAMTYIGKLLVMPSRLQAQKSAVLPLVKQALVDRCKERIPHVCLRIGPSSNIALRRDKEALREVFKSLWIVGLVSIETID